MLREDGLDLRASRNELPSHLEQGRVLRGRRGGSADEAEDERQVIHRVPPDEGEHAALPVSTVEPSPAPTASSAQTEKGPGRQDLNLRPLGHENGPRVLDTFTTVPMVPQASGIPRNGAGAIRVVAAPPKMTS
jgi:hypothetical protein